MAVGALLALVTAAAYAAYIGHGGFYADDWAHVAAYRFADSPRYWSTFSEFHETLGGRPLFALLLPLPQAIFGADPAPHLALAAALGAAASFLFYVLLRTLEMPPLHAGAIAILACLFPWSDSIRLWPTGSLIVVSVCFFLIALTLALRGFDREGRAAIATHAAAVLFYALSVLTYEATAAAALLAGLLYWGRGSPATVTRRWVADVVVVLAALAYSYSATTSSRPVGSPVERLEDVGRFTKEALLLLVSALEPFGSPGRMIQALTLLVSALVVVAALRRVRRGDDQGIAGWLRWIAIGAVAVAAAYFMFLGSHLYPRDPGIDNRINVLAGFAYCLLAYAVIACACRLLLGSGVAAAAATVSIAVAVGIGYEIHLAQDQSDWRQAASRQGEVLDSIDERLPPLPPGSIVLSFGAAAQVAPEVPVFDRSWDLSGALRLRRKNASIRAYPVFEGVDVSCKGELSVDGGGGYGVFSVPYRRLYFVGPGGSTEVRSISSCERALSRFRPGPLES